MKKNLKLNWESYFFVYIILLILFGISFLYNKHDIGNDSSISDWFINYSGGFVRRGLTGEIITNFSSIFSIGLRDVILIFQIIFFILLYYLIFLFCKKLLFNRLLILSILSPIFVIYPVAEIEALGRKELIIFFIYLTYLFSNIRSIQIQLIYKFLLFPICILIWEPSIVFFTHIFLVDLFVFRVKKFDRIFFNLIISFLPLLTIAIIIYLNPISPENYLMMADNLKSEFNEFCYMSCSFVGAQSDNSFNELFETLKEKFKISYAFRYLLIVLIGFLPLTMLLKYSSIKKKNSIIFEKKFKNLFLIFFIIFLPSTILYFVMYDWARIVHIAYFFSLMTFLFLLKKNFILLDKNKIRTNFISDISKKKFLIVFIIFTLGWNPKVVMSDDVASKPIYAIPHKFYKLFLKNL
tara:strand:- start:129 stop:1355 length:1227 start_codon:yes stop_codon:yes gene_type:complete